MVFGRVEGDEIGPFPFVKLGIEIIAMSLAVCVVEEQRDQAG